MAVSQGSVLGSFFFLVIINDLSKNVAVKPIVYADNTDLFHAIRSIETLTKTMNGAKLSALNYFSTNGLLCNNDKSQHLLLSLSREFKHFSVKILGIHLDTKLNWATHIQ